MSNFHSDEWIMEHLDEHRRESNLRFPEERIVGLFYQGSGNYGLDMENSDVDTKLIVTPSFDEICFDRKPHSTTYIRPNNEHIDIKDIRLYIQAFRKQNLNFVEILFTQYEWLGPLYSNEWERLIAAREAIARYNPYRAVKTMKGIAFGRFQAIENEYSVSKTDKILGHDYDGKKLCHLLRIEEYLRRYVEGEAYEECLRPRHPEYLKSVKHGCYSLRWARLLAAAAIDRITAIADDYCSKIPDKGNPEVDALLDDVQRNIMRIAMLRDLDRGK